jgi:hypothetical protein
MNSPFTIHHLPKAKAFQSGQALIVLLFFVIVAITIAASAAFIIAANSTAASNVVEGIAAKEMADSGAESAMLGLLRFNDSYTGETLSVNGGTVVVTVTGGVTKTITSTATNGNFIKKVVVIVDYSNNVLSAPSSWKEVNN